MPEGSGYDPELRAVLQLATDSELYELERILFGPRCCALFFISYNYMDCKTESFGFSRTIFSSRVVWLLESASFRANISCCEIPMPRHNESCQLYDL